MLSLTTLSFAPASSPETTPLSQTLQTINQQLTQPPYSNHLLSDYLRESSAIISRLFVAVGEDVASAFTEFRRTSRETMVLDAAALIDSLREEMGLIARDARAAGAYRDNSVDVRDVGAVGDGVADDLPAFRRAIERAREMAAISRGRSIGGSARIVVPAGRYLLKSRGGPHLALRDFEHLSVEGEDGAWLIMGGIGACFEISGSRNVRVSNLTIDADPLPFSQATIDRVDGQNVAIEFRLWDGYPDPSSDLFARARYFRGTARDPKTRLLIRECGDPRIKEVTPLGGGRFRATLMDNQQKSSPAVVANFRPGMVFVINARQIPGSGCALTVRNSDYVTFERVRVHASWGHVLLGVDSTGIKVVDCAFEPLPGSDRFALNVADGIHLSNQKKGPYVERTRIHMVNDDCFNSYSKWHVIGRQDAPDLLTLAGGVAAPTLDRYLVGDDVAIADPSTGRLTGCAKVVEVKATKWKGRDAVQLKIDPPIDNLRTRDTVGKGLIGEREHLRANPPYAHFICNLRRKGDGFVLRNCDWGFNRASGAKIKAPNGIVSGMEMKRHQGSCLQLKLALNWREGYYPTNIVVRDNVFYNRVGLVRSLQIPGGKNLPHKGLFRGIVEEGNELRNEKKLALPWVEQ